MNTAMIELQAAVMAASTGSSNALTDIPEGGESFSDVLAAQQGLTVENNAVQQAVEGGDTEMPEEMNGGIPEIMNIIENADESIKEALTRLLETVLKAFRGAEDGKDRKTDIFMLFSDGSAGIGEEGEDNMLLGAEILCQTGLMFGQELEDGEETDEIITKIEDMIIRVLGEDNGENGTSAAEILAAMMDTSVNQLEFADTAEVQNAIDVLTAAKESLSPEYAEKAEVLFMEYKSADKSSVADGGMAEMMKLSFQTVKINNASMQVESIGMTESGAEVNTEEAVNAETPAETELNEAAEMTDAEGAVNAAAVMQNVSDFTVSEVKAPENLDAATGDSVEIQIREFVSERLMDIKSDNGTSELTMILKPENLGEVAVKLIKENGAVTVMISAQYDEVGKLMSDRAAALGANLQNQNYNVKDIQVVAAGNAAEQMGLDFTNQGFGFMQGNANQQNSSGNYHSTEAIESVDGAESVTETKLKEAKLWATA